MANASYSDDFTGLPQDAANDTDYLSNRFFSSDGWDDADITTAEAAVKLVRDLADQLEDALRAVAGTSAALEIRDVLIDELDGNHISEIVAELAEAEAAA